MIFLSSGQSWQQYLALGKFSLIHFVTEIQILYFSFASLQINDPCNEDALPRSGFSKQIKRNNKAKLRIGNWVWKVGGHLVFICFSFCFFEDAVMSCYTDRLFDIISLIKDIGNQHC